MRKNILFIIGLLWICSCLCHSQESKTPQPQSKPTVVSAKDYEELGKKFVSLLVEKRFEEAVSRCDATMKKMVSGWNLRLTWWNLTSKNGDFDKIVEVRHIKWPPYIIVFVTCQFKNERLDVKVVFNQSQEVSGLFFIPAYKTPSYVKNDLFQEEEITIGTEEWAIPGTLTMPKATSPVPAIILVPGSGPNDRDETIGPNKPFRDLAWGLASLGIAVLRYDKRTLIHGEKILKIIDKFTVNEEEVEDTISAVGLLKKDTRVRQDRIFLLGHSLGGMMLPRIAKQAAKDTAGFIVMAGPTMPLEDITLDQLQYIFSLDGKISDDKKQHLERSKADVAKIKKLGTESLKPASEPVYLLGGGVQYWLDLKGYRPGEVAKEIPLPWLILQGERDYQVTMANFVGWQKAFSGRKDVELKSYPALNHLFIEGKGKSVPSEYQNQGNVSIDVIQDIALWIKKR